jgi:hypothetical protein
MTKLGMTCYTKRDDKVVSCDGDVFANKLRANDYVKIGNFPPMKIASIVSSGVNLEREVVGASALNAATFKIAEDTRTGIVAGMKAYKNGDVLIGEVQSVADTGDPGDTITLTGNAVAVAAIGDKVTFKGPANTDNYNTTHFLSGLTPTNDRANKVDTFHYTMGSRSQHHTVPKYGKYTLMICGMQTKIWLASATQDGQATIVVSVNAHSGMIH